MLGYGVKMSGDPRRAPIRTLLPGMSIPDSPDNQGATGYGGFNAAKDMTTETPISGDHGDGDLRQSNFTGSPVRTGQQYTGMRMGVISQSEMGVDLIQGAYKGAFSQAQRLRNNVHFNMQGLTRRILSPDAQTQTEQGYTLPLQWFAYLTKNFHAGPAGRNVAGSMMAAKQPSLKRPAPTASIPTAMPWNSAPGGYDV